VEKHPRLVELIKGITDWLINLNIRNTVKSNNVLTKNFFVNFT